MRQTLKGVVSAVKGRHLTIKMEYGMKRVITVSKQCFLECGDEVHVQFDYTADKIAALTCVGEHLPDPKAKPGKKLLSVTPHLEDTKTLKERRFSETDG